GNGRHGLSLLYGAAGTAVAGNQIGIAGRNVPLGNAQNGILIFDAKTNLVGGTEEGTANIIAHNGEEGVVVNGVDAVENTLRQNSIYANARGGIVLRDNANAGILPPRVVNLSPIAGHATPDATVEFFADVAGQGEHFIGNATTNGDGAFSAPFELAPYVGQQLTATVTDAAGNTSAFTEPRPIVDSGGEGEGEGEGECADPCEAVADSDGDGLTDCLEVCEYQTDPEQSDSDGDGMPDNYEREFETGLDPLAGEDGGLDADGDTLSNFEEFLRRTSPLDAADPDIVIFVAPPPLGADAPGRGTLPQPYATIAFALTQISPTAEIPARIVLLGGGYAEDAVLAPFVTLVGFPGADAVVEGTLIVSPPAQVLDLTLQAGAAAQTLLTVAGGDGAVLLAGLLFSGAGQSGVTGVMLEEGAGGVELESCRFDALALGLRAEGPVPRLRRCAFSNVNTGVQIAASDAAMAKSLGDAADPATGWNDFDLASIAGPAVVNERPEELKAELNNWTTDDAEAIGAKLEGTVDFEPFLVTEQEASILAASLYCTVWDSSTQTPIENGTVELTPSGYPPVTENTEGLYTFPVLAAGAYDVEVNALGFAGGAAAVELADGELKSIVVPLGVPGRRAKAKAKIPRCAVGDLRATAVPFGQKAPSWSLRFLSPRASRIPGAASS
ncbi:MAG: hypothetical protein HYZ00_08910, partial [Candidatus Hydrogenedentes bacterium]|nr:hypothetical protein [Candidatus Hydrogenedentota bacterium]